MRKFNVNVDGKNYQVEIEEVGVAAATPAIAAPAVTLVAAAPVAAAPVAAPVAAAPVVAPAAAGNGTPVKSPMPGTVMSFKVASGASVKKGTPVFVLEAMKMENDIVSPCDGIVSFAVSKGATVQTGDIVAYVG